MATKVHVPDVQATIGYVGFHLWPYDMDRMKPCALGGSIKVKFFFGKSQKLIRSKTILAKQTFSGTGRPDDHTIAQAKVDVLNELEAKLLEHSILMPANIELRDVDGL